MTGTNYVSISRRALDLEDYIDIARRHMGWIIGPAFAGLVLSVVVANFLPNVYVSRAVMQITPAQISENLVQSTSTQMLNDRVAQMQNEILSRSSLSAIIQDPKLNLYASELKRKPMEDVLEQMKSDVRIGIDSTPAGSSKRASAFTIQFSYPDRVKAHDTVQMFVTKFYDANLRSQQDASRTVKNFFDTELQQAKANLDQLDEQLTKFRIQNTGKLPEEAQYNISNLNNLQQSANNISESLNRSEQAKLQLEAAISAAKTQVQAAEAFSQDTDLSSPQGMAKNEELTSLNKRVKDIDTDLAVLSQSYSDKYPTVRELKKTRAVLAKQRDDLQKEQDSEEEKRKAAEGRDAKPRKTDSKMASYLADAKAKVDQLNAQMEGVRMQKAKDQEKLDKINSDLVRYRQRLADTPGIDLTYKALEREEQNAQARYQDYLKKQSLALQSDAMVSAKAAENLEVLDPPSLPEQPSAPKRPLIVGAGFAGSIMVGFVLAAAREVKDASLKNLKDVRAYTNMPVLSSIPLLENALLVRRKRRITYLAWSAAVIVGLIMVTVSLYYRFAGSTV